MTRLLAGNPITVHFVESFLRRICVCPTCTIYIVPESFPLASLNAGRYIGLRTDTVAIMCNCWYEQNLQGFANALDRMYHTNKRFQCLVQIVAQAIALILPYRCFLKIYAGPHHYDILHCSLQIIDERFDSLLNGYAR